MIATLAAHTIGVIGSGTEEHDDIASEIGALLAAMEVNLLTGGGAGVMRSVSRFHHRGTERTEVSLCSLCLCGEYHAGGGTLNRDPENVMLRAGFFFPPL